MCDVLTFIKKKKTTTPLHYKLPRAYLHNFIMWMGCNRKAGLYFYNGNYKWALRQQANLGKEPPTESPLPPTRCRGRSVCCQYLPCTPNRAAIGISTRGRAQVDILKRVHTQRRAAEGNISVTTWQWNCGFLFSQGRVKYSLIPDVCKKKRKEKKTLQWSNPHAQKTNRES